MRDRHRAGARGAHFHGAVSLPKGLGKTVKIDRVMKEDWKVREGEEPRRDQLVFFKLTLSRGDDDDVLFEVDPPWVPKPPTG